MFITDIELGATYRLVRPHYPECLVQVVRTVTRVPSDDHSVTVRDLLTGGEWEVKPHHIQPQHDLAGLEARMALLLPLEEACVALHAFRQGSQEHLTPREREELTVAIRALALVIESLQNR